MFNNGKVILLRMWYWVRWPFTAIILGYVVLVLYRVNYFFNQDKVVADVAAIHANKLTRAHVYGPLPPVPEPLKNKKTLVGVDSNNNGIRDDVEIAIYNSHKDSAKTTAAMLQYANALQMEFTQVYNGDTLVAVIQEEARGSFCIGDNDKEIKEVEDLTFNTEARKLYQESLYKKYMTSYGLPSAKIACDISV